MAGVLASLAVGLFFVISGFLIAQSVLARTSASGFDANAFAAARARRILPPFLFAVAITALSVAIIKFCNLYGSVGYQLPGDFESFRARLISHGAKCFGR